MLYQYKSANSDADAVVSANCRAVIRVLKSPLVSEVQQTFGDWATQTVRCSVCLLYWYKSTKCTRRSVTGPRRQSGTQFTCFTGTKVPILTQASRLYAGARAVEIEWTVGPLPIDDGA